MQSVLDSPVAADQLQQLCWSSALDLPVGVWSRQARDEVPHLAVGTPLVLRGAFGAPHSAHLVPITVPIPLLSKIEGRLLRLGTRRAARCPAASVAGCL